MPWILRLPARGTVAERLNALRGFWSGPDAEVAAALAPVGGAARHGPPPLFVPADLVPPGVAYEAHIACTAQVPTRDNAHDLLNGLVCIVHNGNQLNLIITFHIVVNA